MLRVAAVSYFNARPLLGDLALRPDFELAEMPPAEVARALKEGRADVGLVPCAALLDDPRLTYLPGLCIGARGEVDSVFLWLREGALESAGDRSLAIGLDPHSRTSRLLARIWFEEFRSLEPSACRYVEASPQRLLESEEAREDFDAFLVIGDLAMLREPGRGWCKIDLAEAWLQQTGLPFVFAVWGLDRELLAKRPELTAIFEAALDEGLQRIDDFVAADARRRGLDAERASRYLRERIVYRMDEAARRGLEVFLEIAGRLEQTEGSVAAPKRGPTEE